MVDCHTTDEAASMKSTIQALAGALLTAALVAGCQ